MNRDARIAVVGSFAVGLRMKLPRFPLAGETLLGAGYGKHWLRELLTVRGKDPARYEAVRERCGELVKACVATATRDEIAAITRVANSLIAESGRAA